jgi:deoxyhypusine synthase
MDLRPEDLQTLQRVHTVSIHQRPHKVTVTDFIDVHDWRSRRTLRTLFPRILKGQDIAAVVDGFVAAHRRGRAIIFALGAHVIKCGLSPLLIDMMRRGWLSGLVMNGAGAIHDLEVALIGATSEDVAQHLGTGMFGMVEETPRLINAALQTYAGPQVGMGTALGQAIAQGEYPYKAYSLLAAAHTYQIPVTVHVAIGRIRFICTPALMGRSWGRPPIPTFSA